MRLFAASALVSLISLGGCASAVYEGKYAWAAGWRAAEVVEVLSAAEMVRPRFYECVRQTPPEQLATAKFAVVKYRNMSRTQRRAVPLGEGQVLQPGEAVYVQAGRCDVPPVRRNSKTRQS